MTKTFLDLWVSLLILGAIFGFEVLTMSVDPRKLVGMSMGARKRAARQLAYDPWGRLRDAHRPYTMVRAAYRIGERLRPCPGCEECQGWDVEMGLDHCDGSGVLPAKHHSSF